MMPARAPIKRPVAPVQPGAMTSLGGIPQPVQPGQIQAPNLPGSPPPPPFNFVPPTLGAAPTATPYADFVAPTGPDPYQFRVDQANKGANRSAAAHGNLLSGGFQVALAKLNQGLASEETQNIYNRAANTYGLNRETNAQNFGQSLGSYQAGTGAQLDAGRLGLSAATAGYDRAYGAQRDALGDQRADASTQAGVLNANSQARDLFDQQMAEYRAQVEAQKAAENARWNAETTRMQGTIPQAAPASLGFAMPQARFGRGRR